MKTVTIPEPKDILNIFFKIPPRFLGNKFNFILDNVKDAEEREDINIPDSAFVMLDGDISSLSLDCSCRIAWCDERKFSMAIADNLTDVYLKSNGIERHFLGDIRNNIVGEV